MPTFVDLFCGAGGASLGFIQAGWAHLLGLDFDKQACRTYERNIGHVWQADIKGVSWRMIVDVLGVPDHLHASPHCQPFSSAGKREGKNDSRDMAPEWLRLLAEAKESGLMPKTISMENVEGLTQEKHRQYLLGVVSRVEGLGYKLRLTDEGIPPVLDAANYGVPQHRKRLILLGGLDAVPLLPLQTHWSPEERRQSSLFDSRKPWVTVREALAGLGEPVANHIPAAAPAPSAGNLAWQQKHPPMSLDKPAGSIVAKQHAGNVNLIQVDGVANHHGATVKTKDGEFGYSRWWELDCPGGTVTGNDRNWAPQVQGMARRLTVRECMRLQSFPDEFVCESSMSACYRQVGNAVPPLMAKVIAETLQSLHVKE